MKFEKILFHTGFGECALDSLQSVLALKKAGLREIVLAHVVPIDDVAFVPYGGYLKEAAERLQQEAKSHFGKWLETISAMGIRSKIRVEVGSVTARIMAIAQEENVQLIVAGRKDRTLLEMVYVGSHTLDLLRRSPVPVLMSKYMVEYERNGKCLTRVNAHLFAQPLLATDWSGPSENALKLLSGFRDVAEKMQIVHVVCDKLAKGVDPKGLEALKTESRSRLDAYGSILAKEGIRAESHLVFGTPAQEIIRLSRECGASMIVMGRTGKDWFHEYWLGGVSHKVAEASELPVLLVP